MICFNHDCNGTNIEEQSHKTDGQGYWSETTYSCLDCGCEWSEETTIKVIDNGEVIQEDSK
jgi:hypothetical protein